MLDDVRKNSKTGMDSVIASLTRDLGKVRTGKAQVSMLENVMVNYYGTKTPLNQVAALSCPDPRSFLIAPWEASTLKEIETAIVNSDLGMTPMNDGKVIRLKLPELTEQRRKEIVKQMGKIVEDAKVAVRMTRRDANEQIKDLLKNKKISEDEKKRVEDEIQKNTDLYIKKVEELAQKKEKKVMTL